MGTTQTIILLSFTGAFTNPNETMFSSIQDEHWKGNFTTVVASFVRELSSTTVRLQDALDSDLGVFLSGLIKRLISRKTNIPPIFFLIMKLMLTVFSVSLSHAVAFWH